MARSNLVSTLVSCALFLGASIVHAQDNDPLAEPKPAEGAPPAEEEVDENAGTIDDDPSNPDAVTSDDLEERDDIPQVEPPRVRFDKKNYPIELTLRPLTAVEGQTIVSADLRFMTAPVLDMWLRGRYGVTRDIEIGVTFGAFAFYMEDEGSFEPGKAASFDFAYTVFPERLAATASLAFNGDPFATSVAFGAPFRFNFAKKWAFSGGHDLVRFRINEFQPEPADPARSVAESLFADTPGFGTSRGEINLYMALAYQKSAKLAYHGEVGLEFLDFGSDETAVPIFVGATYSPSVNTDLAVRVGFREPDDVGDTTTIHLTGTMRF